MNFERFFQAVLGSVCTGLLFFGAGAVAAKDTQALEPVLFAGVIALFLGLLLGAFMLHIKGSEFAVHAVCLATPLWFIWGYGGLPSLSLLVPVAVLFWGSYGAVFIVYPLLRGRRGTRPV